MRLLKQTSKVNSLGQSTRIHIDQCQFHIEVVLVLVYALTRHIEAKVITNVSSEATIEVFDSKFSRSGLPFSIVSDNSSSFLSEVFQNYVAQNGVDHVCSLAHSSSSLGQTE